MTCRKTLQIFHQGKMRYTQLKYGQKIQKGIMAQQYFLMHVLKMTGDITTGVEECLFYGLNYLNLRRLKMTNEEITKKKQRGYNLTNDEFNRLRTNYVRNLKDIARGITHIAKKVEEGGYTSEKDWKPVFLLFDENFSYWDEYDGRSEKLGQLFYVDEEVY